MITHFTSDLHYGHKNILKHCPLRPYKSIEEMREKFIVNYNSVVGHYDRVCWVGDAFFTSVEDSKQIMMRLNGQKILVMGNHDKSKKAMLEIGFSIVADELTVRIANKTCLVVHYPPKGSKHAGYEYDDRFNDLRPDRKAHEIIIHGHTHYHVKKDGNSIHCGVDAWDYKPVSVKEIEELIR